MSKDKNKTEKAKNPYKDYEEAKAAVAAKEKEVKEAKAAIKTFMKENKIKEGDEISKKLKPDYRILKDARKALETELETIQAHAKELRPARGFASKYEYPKNADGTEMDAKQKKNFRAKARAAAKKGDEPAKEEGKKKDKKADEPVKKEEGKKEEGKEKKKKKED